MNSRKYYQLSSNILLAIAVTILLACGSDEKKGSESAKEFDDAQGQLQDKVDKLILDIPSPTEIPYIIQSTGADFNPNIINDHKKYESYTISAKKAAFNLGVYATDIGYLSSYGRSQEALNYMDVCLELTKSIGAQDAIDFEVLERFEKNLSNPDSLGRIIDHVISNSDSYLQANDRNLSLIHI